MTRISLLLSTGKAIFRAAAESKHTIARGLASRSVAFNAGAATRVKERLFPCAAQFFLGGIALLCLMPMQAQAQAQAQAQQSYTTYLEPQFLWNFYNVQDCGGCGGQNLWFPSLLQTWSYAQSIVDGTHSGSTYTAENLIASPGSLIASTGQNLQSETDYPGLSGLSFTRTYRSNAGYFASVLTQAFVDNSAPAGTVSQRSYPAAGLTAMPTESIVFHTSAFIHM